MPEEENNNPPELVLEEVVEVAPDELSKEQTTYLRENADDLSDEQKETFKEVIEAEEEEEVIDLEKVKIETRRKEQEKKKSKDGEEDEEEEVDPEDEVAIGKVVDKKTAELKKQILDQSNVVEVDALIRDNPELNKYRGVILKHMEHPSYSNIPARNIAAMVSSEDQQKIGAKKERDAAKKAKETQGGGSSARKTKGGEIDWANASPDQVAAKKQEILDRSRE